ncbi:MAG: D-aminoacylase [Pyrinomonadaceae bacterium]|nr:D-aminoacylase [Pyrinomonadaceae bacterium]
MVRKWISSALIVFCLFTVSGIGTTQNPEEYDLAIVNGRIVDGTGNPWFRASIAIKDGKIAKIGNLEGSNARQTINANNKIVAPGFIDVHAHSENVFRNPKAENFIRMGVTSLVTGNCGTSRTDIAEFLGRIKETPIAINISTLIGHNAVRRKIMGSDNRSPTPEEQANMNELVEQGMKDGALGFSTGLIYVPGTYSKTEEVVELAKAASKYKGIYSSHIRDEGTNVIEAINEAINIGKRANMPVEISHFKISSKALWGESVKTVDLVKAARKRGQQVTVDQYSYTASSTSLDARMPSWAIAGGREEGKKRLADPAIRKRIIKEMKSELKKKKFKDFSYAYVANYRANPEFNGKNIAEITKLVRGKKKLNAQIEQFFEMYENGGAQMVYRMMSEEDVKNIMRQPFAMIAADSSVRVFGRGVPHPRGYGNNARVLARYVRDLKIITLEDAVRKMSSLPAQTFGLSDRGLLKKGFAADIVIFDENRVTDKATFENPHQYAVGFQAVIVNGDVVLNAAGMTGKMTGKALFGSGLQK